MKTIFITLAYLALIFVIGFFLAYFAADDQGPLDDD